MSKAISLKVQENIFRDIESIRKEVHVKRNMYINHALDYYNRLMRRKALKEKYLKESKLLSKESLKVLREFEAQEEDIHGL